MANLNAANLNAENLNAEGGAVLPPYPTAPIRVTVAAPTGTAAAAIRVAVSTSGTASAPIRCAVFGSETTTRWTASVTLDGLDVSARLTGVITVSAEEGAARLARFALLPAAGTVDPLAWTGSPVTLDVVRVAGAVTAPVRVFTGRVDVAEYDPITRLVAFNCTDDLQNVVAALDKADIDALVAGRYHVAAQGDIDEHWAYAQARLESRAASLDANAYAGPRVTDWDGLATWRTFDEADLLDGSLSVELPRRRDLVNRVDVAYEYRHHRLRDRRASISFAASIQGADALASGYRLPQRSEIEAALSGCGWQVVSTAFNAGYTYVKISDPTGAPPGGSGDWWMVGGGGVASFSARLAQRHAQTVTESYALTVCAPDSIAANGALAVPLRGALASTWNPEKWEQDLAELPALNDAEQDYAPDYARAESDAAIQTLVDMARVKILASHRHARASGAVPCLPEVDLDKAARFDTVTLDATGKIAAFDHRLDLQSGSATTTITLALSGIAAGGITPSTPVAAPAAPDIEAVTGNDPWADSLPLLNVWVGAVNNHAYSDDLMGFLVNAEPSYSAHNFTLATTISVENAYYDVGTLHGAVLENSAYPVTGFRIRMPGVAPTHRDPVTLEQSASYDVAIPEDPFTLSA